MDTVCRVFAIEPYCKTDTMCRKSSHAPYIVNVSSFGTSCPKELVGHDVPKELTCTDGHDVPRM